MAALPAALYLHTGKSRREDHPPPHFHAIYGESLGLVAIETLEMVEGDLPPRAKKLVTEWAMMNQSELLRMWERQEFHRLPGLD